MIQSQNSKVEQKREHSDIYLNKVTILQSKYIALHVGLFWGIGRFIIHDEDNITIKSKSDDYRTVAFRRHIRDYAVAMCWYKKSEDVKGDKWMAKFENGVYVANAILNGDKNQGMKIIPAYVRKRHPYSTNYGDTSSSID